MASKTVVELVDDLDGGRAEETVQFALDGTDYEIDLSAENAAKLRAALATFVGHAKKHSPEPRAIADTRPTTEATATVPASAEPAHEARPRPVRRTPEPRPAPVHNRAATKAAAQSLAAEPVPEKPAEPQQPKPEPEPKKAPSGPAAALFVPFSETN